MKEIPGYEGLYACSEDGKVYSLPKVIKRKNGWTDVYEYHYHLKELTQLKRSDGQYQVTLCKNFKNKTQLVHNLIALTFLDKKPEQEVIHKDGNKANNIIENLEVRD